MLERATDTVCVERQTPTAAPIREQGNPSARRLRSLYPPTTPSQQVKGSSKMPTPMANDPVVVAPLGSRLIEGERREAGKVESPKRLGDVMLDDPPQPLVGDAAEPSRRQHRHLPDEGHRRLLEQQGETASLPRPWNLHSLHPMLGAVRSRHPRSDQAVVLEEVQVPPDE